MRKIILIFVTIVLPCLLCARNDDKSTDMLLREIDGIIRNRQTYGAEKEARISDLKKLLSRLPPMSSVMDFAAGFSTNIGLIIWTLRMYMHSGSRNWLLI